MAQRSRTSLRRAALADGGSDLDPRERLLEAAVAEFSRRGFHGTTTRDVATRSGLSPAALYVHFPSKDEVLFEIMLGAHQEVLRVMKAAAASTDDPVDRLKAIVRAHVTFHAEHNTLAGVANHELPALSAPAREKILKLRRRIEKIVDSALEAGIAKGFYAVSERRAATFMILSVGIGVSRWFSPTGALQPEELGDLYAEMLVEGLLA